MADQDIIERMRQVFSTPYTGAPPGPLPTPYYPFARQEAAERERALRVFAYTPPVPGSPDAKYPWPPSPPLPEELMQPPTNLPSRTPRLKQTKDEARQERSRIHAAMNFVPSGIEGIASGLSDIPKQPLHGAGEIARGTMKAGAPLLSLALVDPLPVLSAIAAGTAAGYGAGKVATNVFGASPQTAQDIGDVSALATGVLAGGATEISRYGAGRSAAEMSRSAESLFDRALTAPPPEAAALRARAAGLVRGAQDVSPFKPTPTLPPPRPQEPSLPTGKLEPFVADTQRAQVGSQPTTPPPGEPPVPLAPTPGATAAEAARVAQIVGQRAPTPEAVQVQRTRVGQLADTARTTRQAQIAAGITPDQPMSSEAGALLLPTGEEMSAARQWIKTKMFDEYTPIQELAKRAPLAMEDNPYIAARMYAGHQGKIAAKLQELRDIGLPIKQQGLLEPFDQMLALNRDLEWWRRPDIEEYKSPFSTSEADAQAKLDVLRSRLTPQQLNFLDSKAQDMYAFHGDLLHPYHSSGMISDAAYDAIRENNEHYVPFHHLGQLQDDSIPRGGKSLEVRKQGVVYPMAGSETPIASFWESSVRNAARMISTAERNRAARTLADLSQRPEWKGVVHLLDKDEKPGKGEGSFSVFEDGVKHEYAAPGPVAEAVKGFSPRQMGVLWKTIDATNQAVRAGATFYYLPFMARNAIREYRTSFLRSPIGFSPLDMAHGFAVAVKRGPEFWDFMKSGAAQSGFYERDMNVEDAAKHILESDAQRIARHVSPVTWSDGSLEFHNPFTPMRLLSQTIEMAPRIGVYARAKAAGLSDLEAGWLGRNVTQDFSSIGTAMRHWNAVTPFINARAHGAVNVFAAMRDNPLRAGLVIGGSTVLPAVYLHYHNRLLFPDVLEQIPPDERNRNFHFIYGRNQDAKGNFTQVWKAPKMSYDLYFTRPVEAFLDHLYNNNPKSWWKTAAEVMSDVSAVGFMRQGEVSPEKAIVEAFPPIVSTAAELLKGEDFYTGARIEPKGEEGASAWNRWGTTPSTLELENSWAGRRLIQLSRFTRVLSPLQWRHLSRRMLAGGGRLLIEPSEEDSTTSRVLSVLGAKQIKGLFVGAPSGAEAREFEKAQEPYQQEVTDEEVAQQRELTRLLVKARGITDPIKRQGVILDDIENKTVSVKVGTDALNYFNTKAAGLPNEISDMYWEKPRAKAKYLLDQQKKMSKEKYANLENKLIEVGWANGAVYTEMGNIQMEEMEDTVAKPAAAPAPQAAKPAAAPSAPAKVAPASAPDPFIEAMKKGMTGRR
jgi:hypothetical protein